MKIKNLTYRFESQNSDFFHNLSIEIPTHEFNFIQGKNGVGKSTFFKILQGAISPHDTLKGTIEFKDNTYNFEGNIDATFTHQVKTVQQQFDTMLAPSFTFAQNLMLANLPTYPTLASLPDFTLPEFALEFGIDTNKPVNQLSGGQRQILAILMALQKQTKILLLDEPTAALDEKNTHMVIQFLEKLIKTQDLTVLIICHDRTLIERYAKENYYAIEITEDGHRIFQPKPKNIGF